MGFFWLCDSLNKCLLLKLFVSGFGFKLLSMVICILGVWNNIVLKCFGLLKCKYLLVFKIMFMWLCLIIGVDVLIMCNLFDIFKCKINVFLVVLISRYLVWCFIVIMFCFLMFVIFCGMG